MLDDIDALFFEGTSSASTDSGSDAISDRSGRMEEDKISISIEFSPE